MYLITKLNNQNPTCSFKNSEEQWVILFGARIPYQQLKHRNRLPVVTTANLGLMSDIVAILAKKCESLSKWAKFPLELC